MTSTTPDQLLSALRDDIDRIDASMHALLIERGGIIERLIAVKAQQGGGSAFRPGREAEMMRRLAERHRGPLPLDTVESIWRVIISTFTFVQAPYAVQADTGGGDAAMRDTARFHFGFTVPLRTQPDAASVVAAIAAAEGDLGLIPVAPPAGGAPVWPHLVPAEAPKIIARLPFVERHDHPAGLPVYVIARPSVAAAVRDVTLMLVSGPGAERESGSPEGAIVGTAPGLRLMAVADPAAFAAGLADSHPGLSVATIGSHAARYRLTDPAR